MKQKQSQQESNILVAIRIRPLNQKEITIGDWDILRVQDNLMIILDPSQKQFDPDSKKNLDVLHRSKQQRYAFDKIYRNESSEKIYDQTAKSLIKTVISGKNATVFAYGPTGTGKTFTMLGNTEVYGLNVLAIRDIFNLIEEDSQFNYSINITYVEIYNEMIRDLLVPASNYLELRDDSDKGITIAGVTQFKAESTEQVMNLLLMGNRRRTTQATNANLTSSRSHAVFQINVTKVHRTRGTTMETLSGKLSLIDLAGSQRGTVTENRGIRLMEGAKINRSLLALANCINALGDKNKKGFFVPYRDSKLTRLLKDSLGGNCKTVMIVNVSPAGLQFEQTINTLKYANRAKNIKTKALTNKQLVSIHISQYKNIINDLRQQIDQLKFKLQKGGSSENIQTQGIYEPLPLPIGNQNQNQNCNCGKLEQSQQIRKVKEQIFENFNQRIQLRRALMEIQEQNSINLLQIRKKQGEVMLLKKGDCSQGTLEGQKNIEQIKSHIKTIQTLKLNTQKNILKKEITNLQLLESMSGTKKIREQIPKRVKSKENREFLQIIIKNHVLELQNIQLEINLQLQEKIMSDLKNIADTQRSLIQSKGIDFKIDQQIVNNDDIEIQIQEDEDQGEQGPNQIAEEEYQQDFEEQLQNELMIDRKLLRRKNDNFKQNNLQEEKREKVKPLDQNSNNIELGVFGVGNIKKKEKTTTDTKQFGNINKNSFVSGSNTDGNKEQSNSTDNMLDFNLKGVNLKLNQKLPFVMNPKQKKKK